MNEVIEDQIEQNVVKLTAGLRMAWRLFRRWKGAGLRECSCREMEMQKRFDLQ